MTLADAESVLEQRMGMQPIGSNKTVIAEVWGYWVAKRQRLKKPLLRRFWPVTSINDSNPHLVFRPREKERCVVGLGLFVGGG
jgi:enhancer of polycomb-like protein